MKGKVIAYWVTTGLSLVGLGFGGVMDLINAPFAQEIMKHLGYPTYFATMIGIWKMLGLVALAAPGFARAKEWAYAGFAFDLSSATYSHMMAGDGIGTASQPLLFLAVLVASYVLRPQSRLLGQLMGASSSTPSAGAAPAM
jgi:uncharacterized membrane protein YphA (DoxX/SURF4 family)